MMNDMQITICRLKHQSASGYSWHLTDFLLLTTGKYVLSSRNNSTHIIILFAFKLLQGNSYQLINAMQGTDFNLFP